MDEEHVEVLRLKRNPTPIELAVLECARALDRFELELRAHTERLDRLERIEEWIESYRADDRAYQALEGL